MKGREKEKKKRDGANERERERDDASRSGRARGFSIGFQFSRGRHVERIRELVRGHGREYDDVRLPETILSDY